MVSANQHCASGAALICSKQSFCSQLPASSNSKVGTAVFSEEKGRIAGLPTHKGAKLANFVQPFVDTHCLAL